MPRHQGPYLVSQEASDKYNIKVKTANAFLKTVLEDEPNLHFWRHKGLSLHAAHFLASDGTHLNTAGQFKLYKSIRGALIFASKQCSRPR